MPDREYLVLAPAERRDAVLDVIGSARERLVLSLFRAEDVRVLDALAAAAGRGVRVRALLTRRAKGSRQHLTRLVRFMRRIGAEVHRYADPVVKYHAKYIVADDHRALVASLNFNRKCFTESCDFLLVTEDPAVVGGLTTLFEVDCCHPDTPLPTDLADRLIVGPEQARDRFAALIGRARHRVRLIDPKLSDPEMITLLRAQRAAGIDVEVLGRGVVGGLIVHGKMLLVDDRVAAIGSISLSTMALDFRREVAIAIDAPRLVGELNDFFQSLLDRNTGATAGTLPEDVVR